MQYIHQIHKYGLCILVIYIGHLFMDNLLKEYLYKYLIKYYNKEHIDLQQNGLHQQHVHFEEVYIKN